MAPIVKWAGGKARLLDDLVARAPTHYQRYFEPFVGGGALYFRLQPFPAVLSDSNPDLIYMYRCVATQVEAVIDCLAVHDVKHDLKHYYRVREEWNRWNRSVVEARWRSGHELDPARAAAFIYLNKTCYNGLWRVNSRGHFNVPVGRYKDPTICDGAQLRAASCMLQTAELMTCDFSDVLDDARADDFVYFDPPYHPLSDTTQFTGYTSAGFGPTDQRRLAAVVHSLAERGCHVLVSNSDTHFVRELYSDFRVDVVNCTRSINSNARARGPQRELIIDAARKK